MPVQYYMRGYNTAAPGAVGYVEWVVNDAPDSAGTFLPSPFLIGNITGITVNRVVESRVESFLQGREGLSPLTSYAPGLDGFFLHLNSYDFLNPSTPVGTPVAAAPPAGISGIAVVRGTTDGTITNPRPFASLFWEEDIQQWTFAFANDTFASIGALLPVSMGSLTMSSPLTIGTPAANTGDIRLTNTATIKARDVSNFPPGITGDILLIGSDTSNRITLGDNNKTAGFIFDVLAGSTYVFQSNGTPNFTLGDTSLLIDQHVSSPTISQGTQTVSGNGQTLTLQAQNTSVGINGGALNLSSGTGTTTNGSVNIQTGSSTKLIVAPTSITQENSTYAFGGTADLVSVTSPTIKQNDQNAVSGTGQTLTLQAQNSVGATSTGGALTLTSGTGTSVAGNVAIKTGGTPQILVSALPISPGTSSANRTGASIIIYGNLEVVGTTTTVDSTIVDIVGKVIHANWVDPSVTPTIAASTTIVGYSVHRGNNLGVPRDGASWIWTEGALTTGADGYWRAVTIPGDGYGLPDGYTIANSPNIVHVMASDFSASATPNPGAGVLASTGGLRTQNNTTAVASRTAALNSDLLLLATDSTNHIIHGDSVNAGQIFNVSTGSLYNIEVNGVSTYTITPVSAGTTTFQAVSTVTAMVYKQADLTTNGGTGATTTLQAQNETGTTSTGGNLVLTSGTGTTTAGNVNLQTGAATRVSVNPTFTSFSDTAEALRITPVSAGTTQITYASTVTSAQINQTQTASTPAAPMSHQAQVTTAASGVGGTFTITAGNATGTTSTGGALNLASGSGTSTNGVINFQPGGTTQLTLSATGATLQWATGVTSPTLNQANNTTNTATATNLTVQAQNATGTTSTGGDIILTSGTGTTTSGNARLQTGAVDRVIVHPTFTEFRDTSEAYRITPVSAGATTLQAINTATSVTYKQGDLTTNGGTGANTTLQAQNETGTTSTGGNLVLTSGTGTTTAGNVNIQTGGATRMSVNPTFVTYSDTAEAYRVTPVSAGTTTLQFASTVTAATIFQANLTTASGTGAALTVQAQNETGTTSVGGALNLTSGTGTTTNGAVNLQVGGTTTASLVTSKFVFNKGRRRNITAVSTTYQVLISDDYLAVTASSVYTITLPATPTTGDTYEFKDINGTAGTNNITISGNGNNIDGLTTAVLNSNFTTLVVTYTGAQWSIS